MASAWGASWAAAWGNAWGSIAVAQQPTGGLPLRRREPLPLLEERLPRHWRYVARQSFGLHAFARTAFRPAVQRVEPLPAVFVLPAQALAAQGAVFGKGVNLPALGVAALHRARFSRRATVEKSETELLDMIARARD